MNATELSGKPFAEAFGSLVRSKRQLEGMTAQEAYRRGGMTNKTWKRLEDGLPVKPFTIVALDKVFNEQPGTMMKMWEDEDADALARHWRVNTGRPASEIAVPVAIEGIPDPDIHLEVGTRQYEESLAFFLRHDSDSLRLLSGPVYQVMKARATREREGKINAVQGELDKAAKALTEADGDYVQDYLNERIHELERRIAELQLEDTQTSSLVGMLQDRRT